MQPRYWHGNLSTESTFWQILRTLSHTYCDWFNFYNLQPPPIVLMTTWYIHYKFHYKRVRSTQFSAISCCWGFTLLGLSSAMKFYPITLFFFRNGCFYLIWWNYPYICTSLFFFEFPKDKKKNLIGKIFSFQKNISLIKCHKGYAFFL